MNNTGDTPDAAPGNSTCADASGACTLRAAIQETNALAGPDIINFGIAGSGVKVISPATPLPDITGAVTINGTTQTGYAGSPLIQLNEMGAGNGLRALAAAEIVGCRSPTSTPGFISSPDRAAL